MSERLPLFLTTENDPLAHPLLTRGVLFLMLDLEFAELTDPGTARDHNEDALGHVVPKSPDDARLLGWLFVVADGVGGHDRGEVASNLAVESLLAGFRSATRAESLTTVLPQLVKGANTRILETALGARPGTSSMATTVVACALRYNRAIVAHVGDSRCYLVRKDYAVPLTRDHTFSSEQMRLGLVTSREAASAVTARVLSRALGTELFVNVETSEREVLPGDVLLLCSDGLHNSVEPEDIVRIAKNEKPLPKAAEELIALAKERDGGDNITVQLIRIRDVERVGMYRGRHYKLQ